MRQIDKIKGLLGDYTKAGFKKRKSQAVYLELLKLKIKGLFQDPGI